MVLDSYASLSVCLDLTKNQTRQQRSHRLRSKVTWFRGQIKLQNKSRWAHDVEPPYDMRTAQTQERDQNCSRILNNCPIFNPKPALESWERQHLAQQIRPDLANVPCALIVHITVFIQCLTEYCTKALANLVYYAMICPHQEVEQVTHIYRGNFVNIFKTCVYMIDWL